MEYKSEQQRQMAILEAAIPYIAPGNRRGIELVLQANALVQLARQGSASDLEAAEQPAVPFRPNPQEMLVAIQKLLTPRESELVQTVLNFMNAQKLVQRMNGLGPAAFEQLQNLMWNEGGEAKHAGFEQ